MDYPSDPLYTSNHKMVSSLKGYVLKITEKPYPGRPFRNILDAETIYGKFTVNLREIYGKFLGSFPGSSQEAPGKPQGSYWKTLRRFAEEGGQQTQVSLEGVGPQFGDELDGARLRTHGQCQ